ncbi:MAG TPA: carbon monoxide dehydrogenase subunit G [Woeseiaceae bacterium]|nr:carbon monoxide dehydrogenase subunit G [Woeseiaceae bacterium]
MKAARQDDHEENRLMDITGEYHIAAKREAVWAALNDPEMLKTCIQGCEALEQTGDNEFHGKVAAVIGPVRAKFNLVLRLENVVAPESYTLTGESKAGTVGFGRGSADVALTEQDGGTLLKYSAEFKVGGKLAQVGSRLVVGATKKTADDFFGCLSSQLGAQAPDTSVDEAAVSGEAEPAAAEPRDASRIPLIAGLAAAGLLAWWFLVR